MGVVRESLLEKKAEFEKWLEGTAKTRKHMEDELKNFDNRVSEAKEAIKEINELLGVQKEFVVNVNKIGHSTANTADVIAKSVYKEVNTLSMD